MLHVGAGEGPGPIRERPEVVHLPAVRDLDPLAPAPGRVRREREFGIRFFRRAGLVVTDNPASCSWRVSGYDVICWP